MQARNQVIAIYFLSKMLSIIIINSVMVKLGFGQMGIKSLKRIEGVWERATKNKLIYN